MYKKIFNRLYDNKIKKIDQDFADKWIEKELLEEYRAQRRKYNEISKEKNDFYENNKLGRYKFWLFLSFIAFVIPYFFVRKKYNKLVEQYEKFDIELLKLEIEMVDVHKKMIASYSFDRYYEKISSLLEYENKGPVTNGLLNSLKSMGVYDMRINDEQNPSSSSWGIFKGNKIILSPSKQMFNADSSNVNFSNNKYVYLEDFGGLEFNFQNKFKQEGKIDLENKGFDDDFWWRNDDVKFRAFFTPLAQENYLKEINYTYWDEIPKEDRYLKVSNFFTNEYTWESKTILYKKTAKLFREFVNNPISSFKELTKKYSRLVKNLLYSEFNNMKYLYVFPFFESVNHTNIIKKLEKQKEEFNSWDIFYIFDEIIKEYSDDNFINTGRRLLNYDLTQGVGTGTIEERVVKRIGTRTAFYVELKPTKKYIVISYLHIKNKKEFYRPFKVGQYLEEPKLNNKRVIELIMEAAKENINIYIKDGFVVAYLKSNKSFDLKVKSVDFLKQIKKEYESK